MPTPGRGKRSAEEKKALKAEQKKKREQKRAKKQEEEDAKAAEEAAKAVAIKEVVTVIQEMEWPRSSLQQRAFPLGSVLALWLLPADVGPRC